MTISPIDTSLYPGLIESVITMPAKGSLSHSVTPIESNDDFSEPVDLSGYYANIANQDLFAAVANNVAESAQALDNAMLTALENGMGVQDAVNINCALNAYKANCTVAKSTFELKI